MKNVAAHEPRPWKRFANPSKHEAGPAANLEKTFRIWKIIAERPLNELIAHAKPEMCLLNRGKPREIFWFEAGRPTRPRQIEISHRAKLDESRTWDISNRRFGSELRMRGTVSFFAQAQSITSRIQER